MSRDDGPWQRSGWRHHANGTVECAHCLERFLAEETHSIRVHEDICLERPRCVVSDGLVDVALSPAALCLALLAALPEPLRGQAITLARTTQEALDANPEVRIRLTIGRVIVPTVPL